MTSLGGAYVVRDAMINSVGGKLSFIKTLLQLYLKKGDPHYYRFIEKMVLDNTKTPFRFL